MSKVNSTNYVWDARFDHFITQIGPKMNIYEWQKLGLHPNISINQLLKKYNKPWNWSWLSRIPSINWKIVLG